MSDLAKELQESIFIKSKEDLKETLSLLKEYSFYDLLFYLVISINNKSKQGVSVADLPISAIEYAISLVLSLDQDKMGNKRTEDENICIQFSNLIEGLSTSAGLGTMLFSEDPLVAKVSGNSLLVRGNDYDHHLIDYLEVLFNDFNNFFEEKIGFNCKDIINFYEKSRVINKKQPFVFHPKTTQESKICEYLSASIGDNSKFLEGTYGGLFGNQSIVPEKCIIYSQNTYLIFQPLLILQNIKDNFENELKKDQKIWHKYDKHRANIIEKNGIEYITNLLPGSISYKNLKYGGKYETDGLIIYDNNLFIIEAKAGVLRKRSTKGDTQALEEDIKKLMLEGYEQGLRTQTYIENNITSQFIDMNGEKISLNRKDFNEIFIINITGDYLGPIAINLDQQKNKGKIRDNINFWSIYINDLRVISELIEFPSQFILFLKRRIKLIDLPQINFSDELDIFIEFLENGLYYDNGKVYGKDINDFTMFAMDTTGTDKIDRYYWGESDKPQMQLDEEIKKIISSISHSGKQGFSEVAVFLLSINHNDFLKTLQLLKEKYLKDNLSHQATLLFKEPKTIEIMILNDSDNIDKYIEYSKIKLLQLDYTKAYNIFFESDNKGDIKHKDFKIIKADEIIITDDLEESIKNIKNNSGTILNINTHKPITRKQPCPCGSGKKFKRCCRDKHYN